MNIIQENLSTALTGNTRRPKKGDPCWVVTGVNGRGESFTTTTGLGAYQSRVDAQEFADEINTLGGKATVEKTLRS